MSKINIFKLRYTHFTSPIRRYPDIMVHRFLAASLNYQKRPKYSVEQVEAIAQHCNIKKTSAKAVSDGSARIFFNTFIKVFLNNNIERIF